MNHRRILRAAVVPFLLVAAPFVGCRQVIGVDEPVACTSDDACNTADEPCKVGECVDGYCAYALRDAGTVIDTADELDCKSHVCDDTGAVVLAAASDDAPPDDAAGDCASPACDADGNIVSAPNADDLPGGDVAGDCKKPGCAEGAPADVEDDADVPEDTTAGDCESPGCDAGAVVTVVNTMDTPAEDIDGDCLAPTCDAGGMLAVDDTDTPTSGCGSCLNGAVVPWAEVNTACYTGMTGTQNVGPCIGGTFVCQDNLKVCQGEITPSQEQCGPGFSGIDDDCDGAADEDGPGCSCQLGMTQACYTGPASTQHVGKCVDGLSTCATTMNGNQYGSCVGEVLPQACDSCMVNGDEDCSGSSEACTGSHVFSKAFGNATADALVSVAQLSNGELLAIGNFSGTLTAANTVTSDGLTDAVLMRFDADGNAINTRDFGGTAGDSGGGVMRMDDGYMIWGTLGDGSSETFGSGSTFTGVGTDGYIAKFGSNHSLMWKKLLGGTGNERIMGFARMPDNGVVVVGQFPGTLNLGGSNLSSLGFDDIFVVRYDAAGNHVWSKRFGDAMQNNVNDVAVAPNGDIVIVGEFGTSANFGGSTINVVGGIDAYIARLDQNGTHVFTKAFQSAGNEYASRIGMLTDGSTWIVGTFDTAVNVDGVLGNEETPTSTGSDVLMVKYTATGTYSTSAAINATSTTFIRDVVVGADGGLMVAGSYQGSIYLSMLTAPSAGGYDAFMFKANSKGNVLWSRKAGDTLSDAFFGVDVAPCGDVFAVGDFTNSVNFGGGALPNNGSYDSVIAKYRQ